MLTASDALPAALSTSRRRRLLLFGLLALLPMAVAAMGVKRRWDGLREEGIAHDRSAADYARVAAVCRKNIEEYAHGAEALEKSARGFEDPMIGPLPLALEARVHEADTRAQETYYLKKIDEEKRLAESARSRW